MCSLWLGGLVTLEVEHSCLNRYSDLSFDDWCFLLWDCFEFVWFVVLSGL